jgi:arylsulfatase A-like enzyme
VNTAGQRNQSPRPGSIILLALWFGLVTGLIESVVLAIRSYGLGHLIHVSWHFPWMVPVADALFFVVPGLFLAIAARIAPRLIGFRVVVFFYLAMALAALLLMYPRIQPWASALLAAGLAFQLARTLSRHRSGMERLVRRSAILLAALVVGLAGGMLGYQRLQERRAVSKLGDAKEGAPNVLLIILDTVRAANLSLYGYPRATTPVLSRLAATGIRYDQAISTAPWTLPAHASLLTGRWPHELSADWIVPLDGTHPTLAEYFGSRGYVTGGFVANVGYCSWEFGLDRGFTRYRDYPLNLPTIVLSSSIGRQLDRNLRLRNLVKSDQHLVRVAAPHINGQFLDWLDDRGERPFFAMLNFYDAHGPYLPPAPFDRKFSPAGRDADLSPLHRYLSRPRRTLLPEAVVQREIDQYDGALAFLDQELGKLMDALGSRGLLENTIVLLTSDHGEEFGEHGIYDHGNTLYRPSVHVPLLIVQPGAIPGPKVITQPVSLRNVPRTLALLATGESGPFPGHSLVGPWQDSLPSGDNPVMAEVRKGLRTPEWHPVTRGDMYSVVMDSMRLIHNGDGSEELYRFYDDPWERNKLVTDSTQAGLRRLRASLPNPPAAEGPTKERQ